MIYNSTVVFALIDNLEGINYNFTNGSYKVQRDHVKKWYGKDLSDLLEKDVWKNEVQDKLKDIGYVNKCSKVILKKQ